MPKMISIILDLEKIPLYAAGINVTNVPAFESPRPSARKVPQPPALRRANDNVTKIPIEAITKNGITSPREGTVGRKLWRLFDKAWDEGATTRGDVLKKLPDSLNKGNAATELSRWRKFHERSWTA